MATPSKTLAWWVGQDLGRLAAARVSRHQHHLPRISCKYAHTCTLRRLWSVWHCWYIYHKDPELLPDWAILYPATTTTFPVYRVNMPIHICAYMCSHTFKCSNMRSPRTHTLGSPRQTKRNLRTATPRKCAAVPRRVRIQGS